MTYEEKQLQAFYRKRLHSLRKAFGENAFRLGEKPPKPFVAAPKDETREQRIQAMSQKVSQEEPPEEREAYAREMPAPKAKIPAQPPAAKPRLRDLSDQELDQYRRQHEENKVYVLRNQGKEATAAAREYERRINAPGGVLDRVGKEIEVSLRSLLEDAGVDPGVAVSLAKEAVASGKQSSNKTRYVGGLPATLLLHARKYIQEKGVAINQQPNLKTKQGLLQSFYLQGLSIEQIAEQTHWSTGRVRSALTQARDWLFSKKETDKEMQHKKAERALVESRISQLSTQGHGATEIARMLGISRAYAWRTLEKLKQRG